MALPSLVSLNNVFAETSFLQLQIVLHSGSRTISNYPEKSYVTFV